MTDGVFFLKASPIALPEGVKGIALDPPAFGISCPGSDPRCSTAYSQLWHYLGGNAGAVANLKKKFGIDGRVAFVGFSAAHGFLNPLLANDDDRAATSAVLLLDATFGGGKTGYVKAAKDAAANKMLFAVATSDKGSKDALNNGDYAWQEFVWKLANPVAMTASPVPPMPTPGEGVQRAGGLWYYRYKDSEIHHWNMGKLLPSFVEAHLLPYWRGATTTSSSGKSLLIPLVLSGLGMYLTWRWLSRDTRKE
jgi:hypothetical protein